MSYSGINMSDVRAKNKSAILCLLNSKGDLSRKDIADILGLTPAAVSILTAELLSENYIKENGKETSKQAKAGRKKVLLSLCLYNFYAVAVNIEMETAEISMVRLDGMLVSKLSVDVSKYVKDSIEEIAFGINKIIDDSHIAKESIMGIGIGLVGSYDSDKDETGEYGIWPIGSKIVKLLQKKVDFPVVCDNSVKAFAIAQTLYGDNKENSTLFFKWSQNLGSALVLDGTLYKGAQEIGHFIVDNNGKQCRCGRHGCLETIASEAALCDRIKEIFSKEKTPKLFKITGGYEELIPEFVGRVKFSELDEPVVDILKDAIKSVARAVINSATVIAPDKVVCFGKMFSPEVFECFRSECDNFTTRNNENFIMMSPFQEVSEYIGPAALVSAKLFFMK